MPSGNIFSMEMRACRRPVVNDCGQLLHGVVRVLDGGHERPLAGARVRVAVDGDAGEATATTRHDGSYSLVVGSCRRRKRTVERLELHVVHSAPCTARNATRVVQLEAGAFDERAVWRQDVVLHASEAQSLCEVVNKSPIGRASDSKIRLEVDTNDVYRLAEGLAKILVLTWGLVVLWAVAVWVTNNQPRPETRIHRVGFADEDPAEPAHRRERDSRDRRRHKTPRSIVIPEDWGRPPRSRSSRSTPQSREVPCPPPRRLIFTIDEDNIESD